jgi:mRNA interferase RelE/StbE
MVYFADMCAGCQQLRYRLNPPPKWKQLKAAAFVERLLFCQKGKGFYDGLKHLPEESRRRIQTLLRGLEQSPLDQPGVKPMLGEWTGYHRVRAGKFRIVFWFDDKDDVVYVDHIGPKGDIYK